MDRDQIGRQQRRIAELLEKFHIQPEPLVRYCHIVYIVRIAGQIMVGQDRYFDAG